VDERPKGRVVHLEVQGDVYSAFSPNRYISGWERRRRVKVWRERVWGCWYRAGAVALNPPVIVTITVLRGRQVDNDNLIASVKSMIDGLTAKSKGPMIRACLPDDSRATIKDLLVGGVFEAKWKGLEQVLINVEEVSTDDWF
jgi:hypothetical protein